MPVTATSRLRELLAAHAAVGNAEHGGRLISAARAMPAEKCSRPAFISGHLASVASGRLLPTIPATDGGLSKVLVRLVIA